MNYGGPLKISPLVRAVLPNLCAARAVEVCCGRMSEIKSFQ